MAITSVNLTGKNRTASADGTTETWMYDVFSDTLGEELSTVQSATGIPQFGSRLSGDVLYVSNISTRLVEGKHFAVDVTFSSRASATAEPEPGGKWNCKIDIASMKYSVPVTKDRNSKPLLTFNKEPFATPLQRQQSDDRITITYRTDVADFSVLDNCLDKINTSAVSINVGSIHRTFAAQTLRLDDRSYGIASDSEGYYDVSMTFVYRADTWKAKIEHKGHKVKNADGVIVTSETEVFLDATGSQLGSGADVVLLEFDVENLSDFSPLFAGLK